MSLRVFGVDFIGLVRTAVGCMQSSAVVAFARDRNLISVQCSRVALAICLAVGLAELKQEPDAPLGLVEDLL